MIWTSSSFNDICRKVFIPKAISKEHIFIGNIYILAQKISQHYALGKIFVFCADEIAGIVVTFMV